MREGVALATVARIIRRREAKAQLVAVAAPSAETVKHPAAKASEWPDRGGVEWAFEDARKQRA